MSKAKAEQPPSNGVIVTTGEEGRAANLAVLSTVREALAKHREGTKLTRCDTNLDLTTFQGKALMMKASSPADYELKGPDELRITVHAFAFFPDMSVDEETGEVKEFTRTVLYDAAGKTFRTTSEHGATRLMIAFATYTPEQWRAGIPFVIRARMGKRGRVYHDIQVDTGGVTAK